MEHFIETVRRYPCLWNTTAIEYRDQELKDAAWTEVMKETDLSSVKEVKLKWKKLRDSYRDALKRQSEVAGRSPGHPAKRACPWKYMGPMQFLQPYMGNRKKAGESPPPPPPPPPAANGRDSDSESEPEPRRRRVARRSLPPERPERPEWVERLEPDPLDTFFSGMCQSTKRFPFHTQIKIKKSLFSAVIAAEEALLAEQQSYAALWARAPPPPPSSSSSEGGGGGRRS